MMYTASISGTREDKHRNEGTNPRWEVPATRKEPEHTAAVQTDECGEHERHVLRSAVAALRVFRAVSCVIHAFCFVLRCRVMSCDTTCCVHAVLCLDEVVCMLARVSVVGVYLYACQRLRVYMCGTTRAAGVFYLFTCRPDLSVADRTICPRSCGVVCHGG